MRTHPVLKTAKKSAKNKKELIKRIHAKTPSLLKMSKIAFVSFRLCCLMVRIKLGMPWLSNWVLKFKKIC
jgi:hypothetical protein